MSTTRITVLLVDDHDVVRLGVRALLSREDGIEIVGEAATAEDAVALAIQLRPAVVLMDVRLPDRSGVDACREIRSADPGIKVVMLTSHADEEAVLNAIMAGASGYVLKQISSKEVLRAIETVAAGQSLLDPQVTLKVMEMMTRRARAPVDDRTVPLSPQEEKVLSLVAEGLTNKEIARELGLSDKTVKNYVSHVLEKLNLSRRAEAAAFFARRLR
jgi:DNA-binding NarL/FixJ family response regulator